MANKASVPKYNVNHSTKFVNPVKYLKNVGKSVTYSTIDKFKDINPTIAEYAETNADLGKMLYESIKDVKGTMKKSKDYVLKSKVGEFAVEYKKAFFEDLRTGKFYNKEREDAMRTRAGGSMFDFSEFDENPFSEFDDDGIDIENDDWNIDKDTEVQIKSNDIIGEKVSTAINSGTARAAEYLSKSNAAALYEMQKHNEAMFNRVNIGLGAINSSIGSIMDFANGVLKVHVENSQKYYDVTTKLDQERNAILKEMLEIQRQQNAMYNTKKASSTSENIKLSDIMSGNSPDIKKYFKKIMQNVNNATMGAGDMMNMFEGGNALLMFASSPLKFLTDRLVQNAVPKAMESSMRELNKTLEGTFDTFINKMNYMRDNSDNQIMKTIGRIFGVENFAKTNIDSSRYNRGPIPWDGESKEALTIVLPGYLSKIEALLTGESERIYDYKNGRWTKASTIRKSFDESRRSLSRDAASDVMSEMFKYADMFGTGDIRNDAKHIKKLKGLVQEMFYQTFLNGTMIPFNDKNFDYNQYGFTGSDWNQVRAMLNSVSRGTMMTYANRMNRNIASNNARMNDLETNGGIERMLFSNFDDGQYSMYDPKTGKPYTVSQRRAMAKGKRLSAIMPEDEYGHNALFYLRNLHEDVRRMYEDGYGLGGSSTYSIGDTSRRKSTYSTEISSRYKDIFNSTKEEDRDTEELKRRLIKLKIADKDGNVKISGDYFNLNDLDDENDKKAVQQYLSHLRNLKSNESLMNKAKELSEKKGNKGLFAKAYDSMAKKGYIGPAAQQFIAGSKNLMKKPGEFVTNVINQVNDQIYRVMYGQPGDKLSVGGFMGQMSAKMAVIFSDFSSYLKDDIFTPIKDTIKRELFGDKVKDAAKKGLAKHGITADSAKDFAKKAFMPYLKYVSTAFKSAAAPAKKYINGGLSAKGKELYAKMDMINDLNSFANPAERQKQWERVYSPNPPEDWEIEADDAIEEQQARGFAKGSRMIKKSGLAVLSRGEMVIPSELNPYFHGTTNKALQIKQESAIAKKYLALRKKLYSDGSENSIPSFSDGGMYDETMIHKEIDANGYTSYWITDREGHKRPVRPVKGKGVSDDDAAAPTQFELVLDRELRDGTGLKDRVADTLKDGIGKVIKSAKKTFNKATGAVKGKTNKNNDKLFDDMTAGLKDDIEQNAPELVGGASIGAILSLFTGAFGPIIGAAAGAGISLIHNSDRIKDWLFGKEITTTDANGNEIKKREGNIISEHMSNNIKKYFPDMAKGATVGAITSILPFVPGGPVAGVVLGSAIGFAKNNETFMSKLFGTKDGDGNRMDDGIIPPGFLNKLDKAAPNMVIGSIAGALALPVPGLLPKLFLGAGLGFVSASDKFKDVVFGKENPETNEREGGIAGALKKGFVDPLVKFGSTLMDNFKKWWKDGFTGPISDALKPIGKQIGLGIRGIGKKIGGKIDKLTAEKLGVPLSDYLKDRLFKPAAGAVKGAVNVALSPITRLAKMPVNIVTGIGNHYRKKQIDEGNADYLTAQERLDWRKKHADIDSRKGLFGNTRLGLANTVGRGLGSISRGLGKAYGILQDKYNESSDKTKAILGGINSAANLATFGGSGLIKNTLLAPLRHMSENYKNGVSNDKSLFNRIDQAMADMSFEDISGVNNALNIINQKDFSAYFGAKQDSAIKAINKTINDGGYNLTIGERNKIFNAMKQGNTKDLYATIKRLNLSPDQKTTLMKKVGEQYSDLQTARDLNGKFHGKKEEAYAQIAKKLNLGENAGKFLQKNEDKLKGYFSKEYDERRKTHENAAETPVEERRHHEIVSLFQKLIEEVKLLRGGDAAKEVKDSRTVQNNLEKIKLKGAFKGFDHLGKVSGTAKKLGKNGDTENVDIDFYCEEYGEDGNPSSGFDSEGNPVQFRTSGIEGDQVKVIDNKNNVSYLVDKNDIISLNDRNGVNADGSSDGNDAVANTKDRAVYGIRRLLRSAKNGLHRLNHLGLTPRFKRQRLIASGDDIGSPEDGKTYKKGDYYWTTNTYGETVRMINTESDTTKPPKFEVDTSDGKSKATILDRLKMKKGIASFIEGGKGFFYDVKNAFNRLFFIKEDDGWLKRIFKIGAVSFGIAKLLNLTPRLSDWWDKKGKAGFSKILTPVKTVIAKGAIALDSAIANIPTALEKIAKNFMVFLKSDFTTSIIGKAENLLVKGYTVYLPKIVESAVVHAWDLIKGVGKGLFNGIVDLASTPTSLVFGNTDEGYNYETGNIFKNIHNNTKNFHLATSLAGDLLGEDFVSKVKNGESSTKSSNSVDGYYSDFDTTEEELASDYGFDISGNGSGLGRSRRKSNLNKYLSGGSSYIPESEDGNSLVYQDSSLSKIEEKYYQINGNVYKAEDVANVIKSEASKGGSKLKQLAKSCFDRNSVGGTITASNIRSFFSTASGYGILSYKIMNKISNRLLKINPVKGYFKITKLGLKLSGGMLKSGTVGGWVGDKVTSSLNKAAAKTINKTASKAAEKAAETATKKGLIAKFIDKILSNKIVKKLTGLKNSTAKFISDKISKVLSKTPKFAKALKIGSIVITLAYAVSDFITGYKNACNYLSILKSDTPKGLSLISGLANALINFISLGMLGEGGFINLTKTLIKAIGTVNEIGMSEAKLQKLQKKAILTVKEYNKDNGTNYTITDFNNHQGLLYKIKSWRKGLFGKKSDPTTEDYNPKYDIKASEMLQKYYQTKDISYLDKATELWDLDKNYGKNSGLVSNPISTISPGFVSQLDTSYSDIPFSTSKDTIDQNIASSGCGPASAVMALNDGSTLSDAAAYAIANGYKTANGGVSADYFDKYYQSKGFNADYSDSKSYIKKMIKSGENVVLLGKSVSNTSKESSPFGPNYHYVVASGIDDGKVVIKDPEQGKERKYNLNKILSSTKLGIGKTNRISSSTVSTSLMSLSAAGSKLKMAERSARMNGRNIRYSNMRGGSTGLGGTMSGTECFIKALAYVETGNPDNLKFGMVHHDSYGYLSLGAFQMYKYNANNLLIDIINLMGGYASLQKFLKTKNYSDDLYTTIVGVLKSKKSNGNYGKYFGSGQSDAIESDEINSALADILTSDAGIKAQLDIYSKNAKTYSRQAKSALCTNTVSDPKILVFLAQGGNHGDTNYQNTYLEVARDMVSRRTFNPKMSFEEFYNAFQADPKFKTVHGYKSSKSYFLESYASRIQKLFTYLSMTLSGISVTDDFGNISSSQLESSISFDTDPHVDGGYKGGQENQSWYSRLWSDILKLGYNLFGIKDESYEEEDGTTAYNPLEDQDYIDRIEEASSGISNMSYKDISSNRDIRYKAYNSIKTLLNGSSSPSKDILDSAQEYINFLSDNDSEFKNKWDSLTTDNQKWNYLKEYLNARPYLGNSSPADIKNNNWIYQSNQNEKALTGLLKKSIDGYPINIQDTNKFMNNKQLMDKLYDYTCKLNSFKADPKANKIQATASNYGKIGTYKSVAYAARSIISYIKSKTYKDPTAELFNKFSGRYVSYNFASPKGGNIYDALAGFMRTTGISGDGIGFYYGTNNGDYYSPKLKDWQTNQLEDLKIKNTGLSSEEIFKRDLMTVSSSMLNPLKNSSSNLNTNTYNTIKNTSSNNESSYDLSKLANEFIREYHDLMSYRKKYGSFDENKVKSLYASYSVLASQLVKNSSKISKLKDYKSWKQAYDNSKYSASNTKITKNTIPGDITYLASKDAFMKELGITKNSYLMSASGGSSYLAPEFISQNNPLYAGVGFGDSTLGKSGCGPATAAMAINGLINQSAKSAGLSIFDSAKEASNYTTNDGTKASYFGDIANKYGANAEYTNSRSKVENDLKDGKQVVLLGRDPSNTSKQDSPFGPGNHYVLAKGISGDKVLINDPELSGPRVYSKSILGKTKLGISISGGDSKITTLMNHIGNLGNKLFGFNEDTLATENQDTYKTFNGFNNFQQTYSNEGGPLGNKVVNIARKYVNNKDIKYLLGGKSLSSGYVDCSGFVAEVFKEAGISGVYGSSRTMGRAGVAVSRDSLRLGDLIFYSNGTMGAGVITHVAIYSGNGNMINCRGHAHENNGNNGDIIEEPIDFGTFKYQYHSARRVIANDGYTRISSINNLNSTTASGSDITSDKVFKDASKPFKSAATTKYRKISGGASDVPVAKVSTGSASHSNVNNAILQQMLTTLKTIAANTVSVSQIVTLLTTIVELVKSGSSSSNKTSASDNAKVNANLTTQLIKNSKDGGGTNDMANLISMISSVLQD